MSSAPRSAILRLYGLTLDSAQQLVGDIPCERFAEQPYADAKHPAWVLQHLCLASGMVLEFLRGNTSGFGGVPETWAENGMPESTLCADRSAYPTKDELLDTLVSIHADLAPTFESVGDEVLAAEFPIEAWRPFFPTIGDAAVYIMAFHEGYHLGQVSQWRRAAGFGPASEG